MYTPAAASPFLDLGRINFGVASGHEKECTQHCFTLRWNWLPRQRSTKLRRAGSHGLGFGTDSIDAPRGAARGAHDTGCRGARSPLPRALSRRKTGREILPFAGLGWFNPGAARSSDPWAARSCSKEQRKLASRGSLQVRRRRVVADGRPSRARALLDNCPGRPPQLGCRRTPTHGVAIRYQRRRLHRGPTVEIGPPRVRRVLCSPSLHAPHCRSQK